LHMRIIKYINITGGVDLHEVLKALADPLRLRIINLLQKGELCVCDLESVLEATQSNVSRHLSKLRSAGVVSTRKKAQWIYYQVKPEFAVENSQLLAHVYTKLQNSPEHYSDLDRLELHLKEKHCEEKR